MKSAGQENSAPKKSETSDTLNLEKILLIEDKLWSLVEIHRTLSKLNPIIVDPPQSSS